MEHVEIEALARIDEDLMEFIVKDTRSLIHSFKDSVLKNRYEVFSKIDKLMERVQNVIQLSFGYCKNLEEKTIPCDVAKLLIDLTELKEAISNCDYLLNEEGDLEKPEIVDQMEEFIIDTASGNFAKGDYSSAVESIEEFRKKKIEEKEAREIRAKQLAKERQELNKQKDKLIEEWLEVNKNEKFDFSVLPEDEKDILQDALKMGMKTITATWLQRKYRMGFPRATFIIDHLEECGALATYEDMDKLGLANLGRIIRVIS